MSGPVRCVMQRNDSKRNTSVPRRSKWLKKNCTGEEWSATKTPLVDKIIIITAGPQVIRHHKSKVQRFACLFVLGASWWRNFRSVCNRSLGFLCSGALFFAGPRCNAALLCRYPFFCWLESNGTPQCAEDLEVEAAEEKPQVLFLRPGFIACHAICHARHCVVWKCTNIE